MDQYRSTDHYKRYDDGYSYKRAPYEFEKGGRQQIKRMLIFLRRLLNGACLATPGTDGYTSSVTSHALDTNASVMNR